MSSSGTNSRHHKNMINMSLQVNKQEDNKLFSSLLSKESSMANPSSRRLYYAGLPGSVPFLWESQPGTPKIATFRDDHHDQLCADHDDHRDLPLPPLTPPPSYFSNNKKAKKLDHCDHHHDHDHRNYKGSRSSNLLSSIFPKKFSISYAFVKFKPGQSLSVSKPNNNSHSESSCMLDHHHCFGSPITTAFRARSASASASGSTSWFSSSSSTTSFDSRGDEEADEVGDGSPNSTLCFFGCYRR